MKSLKKIPFCHKLAALCMIFLISGCNNPSTREDKKNTSQNYKEKIDSIKKEIHLSIDLQGMLNNYTSPMDVALALEKSKAGYYFDITNTPDNVSKYTTEKSKALNLGVYTADLSYSITYKRTDETNKFLYCVSRLADELGVSGVYDQTTKDKLKKYSNNKDSLISLTNSLSSQTKSFLCENDRSQVAVLIVTGGFAEAVYLASVLGEMDIRNNIKIMSVLAAQKDNYDKLMQLLSAYKEDKEMQPITDAMGMLKYIWTNYGIDSGKKIPLEKAVEISDLAKRVRERLVK
ncbi:MAG: hypothetical protein WCI71_17945 [Bacteroidota bacterium]